MQIPLDLKFKGMAHDPSIEDVVEEKLAKLEQVCNRVVSCHVGIEQINNKQQRGHSYRIRIDVKFPPHHDIVVIREPLKGDFNHEPLASIVREAFIATRRQVEKIVDREQKKHKSAPHLMEEQVVEEIEGDIGETLI